MSLRSRPPIGGHLHSPTGQPGISAVSLALAKSRLGVWPVVFMVMAAAAPLTVVAGGATTGFAVTGITGIPLAYLTVAAILAVFSIGYVAMSRRVVNAGAFYTYVSQGTGKVSGVGAAFVAVAGYNTLQVGLYGGFGAVFAGLLTDWFGWSIPWWVLALIGWAIIAVLGMRRIDLNGKILAVMLIAEIGVALVFAVVQIFHPANGDVSWATLSPKHLVSAGIGAALVIAVAGFVGFEGTAVFSEESKDPQRTVARATYLALGIIGVLYALCAWAMSVATGPDKIVEEATNNGTDLIFVLVEPHLGAPVVAIGRLLFVTSLFAALLAFHNTVARYLFALGREGVLPTALGRTASRTRAPIAGSLAQSATGIAVILLYAVGGWDPIVNLFFWLTVAGGLGVLVVMVVTSLAVAVYFSRPANLAAAGVWRGLVAPIIATIALSAVLIATVAQFDVLLGVDPTSPLRWVFPGGFLVAGVLGMIWGLILRSNKPEVFAAIGLGAHNTSVASLADETAEMAAPGPAHARAER